VFWLKRANRRRLEWCRALLGRGVDLTEYASAIAGPHPYLLSATVLGGYFVALATTGGSSIVPFVGLPIIWLLRFVVAPVRGVVAGPSGVALFECTYWRARPSRFLRGAVGAITSGPSVLGFCRVDVLGEQLWLRKPDVVRLQQAHGAHFLGYGFAGPAR
jgi:hypothetical protein